MLKSILTHTYKERIVMAVLQENPQAKHTKETIMPHPILL